MVKANDPNAGAPGYRSGLAYLQPSSKDRMTVNSYRLNGTGTFVLYLYDSSWKELSKQTITADDKIHTITTVSGVFQASIFNTSNTAVARVYEFDMFGTVQDYTPPGIPSGLTGSANDGQVILNWNANSESDIAGYKVYNNGVLYTTVTTTTSTVTGLNNGTDYTFAVSAIDKAGNESGKANLVLAPTPLASPTPAATPEPTPLPTPVATASPSPEPTATPAPTATPEPTPSSTPIGTATPAPSEAPTLDVTIMPEKIGLGKEFTADISLKNVNNIYAEDLELKYDKEHLQYLGFEEVTGYKVYNKPMDQNGTIRFIVASQGEAYGINEDTVILKLRFKAKAPGTAVVDSTKARIADTEEEYDLEAMNCLEDNIIIEATDVNKSGKFTLVDLAIDARYFKYFAADVDPVKYNAQQAGDEYVNDDDLLYIVEQILDNPDYLPNT
ncbi:cohesin domain-containing protein [Paenibacillus sp. FSL R7-0345]|uniref:cohesin domain-containing protein n=1 Tax=Paenibacillus sp. FSL R7-0345 TaxID=2954535 RepID=UPI003159B878